MSFGDLVRLVIWNRPNQANAMKAHRPRIWKRCRKYKANDEQIKEEEKRKILVQDEPIFEWHSLLVFCEWRVFGMQPKVAFVKRFCANKSRCHFGSAQDERSLLVRLGNNRIEMKSSKFDRPMNGQKVNRKIEPKKKPEFVVWFKEIRLFRLFLNACRQIAIINCTVSRHLLNSSSHLKACALIYLNLLLQFCVSVS